MSLTVIGLNHQTAPISVRERLAFPAFMLAEALSALGSEIKIAEAMILSTCNRTEIYCIGDAATVVQWLSSYHQLPLAEFAPYLYQFHDKEAVQHAFRVACGLDSMVLGEPQILGQLKEAVRIARSQHTLHQHLNALFEKTFAAAKEIRNESAVGENSVSMAAAAVKMAAQIFPDISALNVLMVGAGEMIELVATYFAAEHPRRLTVLNRTLARAQELCSKLNVGADARILTALPEILAEYDVVVSSTASPFPVIGKGLVERALKQRRGMPMFLLDLAVPRDIEAEVGELNDAYLYSVDDMVNIVQHGQAARQQAAATAEKMVANKVAEFIAWQQTRRSVPLICALRSQGEEQRSKAVAKALRRLRKGTSIEEVLQRLSHELTNSLLHAPTRALNKDSQQHPELAEAISLIYHLHSDNRQH
ncbi:MAG: glutamyl-tRNA reductase [Snodgrassella sp.]|uniref:glutamyl-tRNA reductase n=1 Tax=Snodgrassella TaxID=1193515 RepID=UPI001EF55C0B|nr:MULTISPECIES: glutamyl-tRNA reductase [Snodgrassella]MCO6505838.1 glutamyl-tRNA reductase [Snodgrassella sp.]MCO6508379.1 glutamyl-tRNA reductase [Snodgrassella sp.]MCO6522669.1 glutamyl-tRNA reductase [Snodgrassella sp.]